MEEIWKTIEGTDNKYSVSNLGNVRRNEHYTIVGPTNTHMNGAKVFYKERLLKKYINKEGYEIVKLVKDNKGMTLKVHRLVANAFIPNPNNYDQVNHINEIRNDNTVNNLQWCNAKQNANHGSRNKKLAMISGIRVAQYTKTGELVKVWDSISQASKYYGTKTTACIRRVCKGSPGRNTYKGYLWKYVDNKVIGDIALKDQLLDTKQKIIEAVINNLSIEEVEILLSNLKNRRQ